MQCGGHRHARTMAVADQQGGSLAFDLQQLSRLARLGIASTTACERATGLQGIGVCHENKLRGSPEPPRCLYTYGPRSAPDDVPVRYDQRAEHPASRTSGAPGRARQLATPAEAITPATMAMPAAMTIGDVAYLEQRRLGPLNRGRRFLPLAAPAGRHIARAGRCRWSAISRLADQFAP